MTANRFLAFPGIIPSSSGTFFGLPDNGFGAQTNSADFVIGFYEFTPHFKTIGDGTTSRGPVMFSSFTPFRDPDGHLIDAGYIIGGPVYTRTTYYRRLANRCRPSIRNGRLLTGADFDVESIARMEDGTFWVGEEFGPYLLHFDAQGRTAGPPVRHPELRAPQNPQNTPANPFNLPQSRGFEAMARNGDGTQAVRHHRGLDVASPDQRILRHLRVRHLAASLHGPNFHLRQGQLGLHHRQPEQHHQHLRHRRHDARGRRPLHHDRAGRLSGPAIYPAQPAAPEEALPLRPERS